MDEKKINIEQNRLHQSLLDIALEFKRICDNNNIPYFIIGGTLLGAVRHKGFIPWDDDFDIGMLRKDFNKFEKVAQKELSSKYFLQTMNTDKYYSLPFAKIRLNGTKYIEAKSKDIKAHNGIFIDIFIYDNIPDNKILQKKQKIKTEILYRILLMKNNYKPWVGGKKINRLIYLPFKMISCILSRTFLRKKYSHEMTKYNEYSTSEVVTFGGNGYDAEKLKLDIVSDFTTIRFENEIFSCPKKYKEYLEKVYGDYMTPPPEDKRENYHGIIQIEFDYNC